MAAKIKPSIKPGKKKFTFINFLQVLTILAILVYMQVAVDSGSVQKVFLASPSSIVQKGFGIIADGTLLPHLWVTLKELLVGYGIALVIGIVFGLIWVLFPTIEEYMNLFCATIMAIPKTAILPLLILWFGIGFKSKVILIILFSVFTILYNTVTGAKQCKVEYLKVARVFQANRFQTVFKVIIPSALPSIFNGLRLAAATSLTGVVFSEMQAAKAGLGFLLSQAQSLLNTPIIFFIIILVTVISVLLVKFISVIEYAVCHKWSRV